MADQKLTALTALAALSADDLFYVVDDPAGAALSRKMAASVLDARYILSGSAAGGDLSGTYPNPSVPALGATFITQTPSAFLGSEQALSALATGLLKNTTTTGVLSIAAEGTDYFNPPFLDTNALIKGSVDATKLLRFEVDGFTTATTRTLTPPDQSGTLALLERAQTFTADQTLATGVSLVSPDVVRLKADIQGELRITSSLSDVTTKRARMSQAHYTNAEEPLLIFTANSQVAANEVNFGGGSSLFNAATQMDFYVGATNTTVTGTNIMRLSTSGMKLASAGQTIAVASTLIEAIQQDAVTNAVTNVLTIAHEGTVAPDVGFGTGLRARGSSSTNFDTMRDYGRLTWELVVPTTATRTTRGKLTSFRITTENESIRWESNATGAMLGFLGAAAINRPAAYTQTFSTADRTFAAYTSDPESSAYTGIDNAQAGTVYAKLTDLNALRVAYETLRVHAEDTAQLVNAILDDLQAYGLAA